MQVSDPGRQHVVQQPDPRGRRLDDREPPGLAVVRGRRGEGSRDRAAHSGLVHRLVGEVPYRPALAQDVGGAKPEHVLCGGPDQCGSARPVATRVRACSDDKLGQPAHHRDRHLIGLALDEFGGRCDLVGHCRDRHLERVAESVGLAAVVAQRQQAGRSDRDVGLAVAPRAAHGVGDEHADVRAGQLADRLSQPPG